MYKCFLKVLAAEDPNNPNLNECKDLLMVGSMGHASSIALGIALNKPSRNIVCLDGDGAMLMHMGIMSTIGSSKLRNLKHILLNNATHDSVGQQPTTGYHTNFVDVAKACGYTWHKSVNSAEDVKAAVIELMKKDGPAFLEIRVRPGAKKDLGRPNETPIHNKKAFMSFLNK
ncbi:phosphonopyruvate decarboxylase [Reticulomyxa filosa]|uniref:Phosphonopyruvate decarboxylase n=1 Tax=Reticulomyxa filosa TaxID=46433 RepID=X6MGI6_RETFI|nr:phosphonopyruvate decarboxylase [Reticulomyxa filosa]|eukprot:ETO12994.1 phosphonopyruvate decarboxylase [Reticulomyxa filosa]